MTNSKCKNTWKKNEDDQYNEHIELNKIEIIFKYLYDNRISLHSHRSFLDVY
jgi:hypothetical protein